MKNISLKLDDDIFADTEKITAKLKRTRNRYINEAVNIYNAINKRRLLKKQMQKESLEGAADAMEILAEFERLEDES
jgi:predicted transcriptional regulator